MTKYTEERKRYIMKWQKDNERAYGFKVNRMKDPELVEFLDEKVKSRKLGDYVKSLIKTDHEARSSEE